MGYVTFYELRAKSLVGLPQERVQEIIKNFVNGNEEARHCLDEDGSGCESGKWYGYDEDLLRLSKESPHIVFTLSGCGEDHGDWWEADFCNGKMVVRMAEIPKQDLSIFRE